MLVYQTIPPQDPPILPYISPRVRTLHTPGAQLLCCW